MKRYTIREARERRGLTQVELAAETALDQSYISRLERGVMSNPTLTAIEALAKALGLAPFQLRFGVKA